MQITPVNLFIGHPSTSETYLTLRPFGSATVPSNTKVIVKQFLLVNVSDNTANVSLSHVLSGDSAGGYNRIFSNLVVSPRTTITLNTTLVMEPGDRLSSQASLGATITLHVNGMVVT